MAESDPIRKSLQVTLDKGFEGREDSAKRVVRLLDLLQAGSTFDTREHKKRFLEEISYDQLKQIGILVNDFSRDKDRTDDFDGKDVQVFNGALRIDRMPPDHEDKEELLQILLETSKGLNVEDGALLLAVGINAIHPFADGNGRVSRLIYMLLTEGYDGSPEALEKILTILGPEGNQYLDPNPDFVIHIADQLLEKKAGIKHGDPDSVTESWSDSNFMGGLTLGTLPVLDEIDTNSRNELLNIIDSRRFRTVTFYNFLKQQDMLREPYIKQKSQEKLRNSSHSEKWTTVQIDEVLKDLSKEQVELLIKESKEARKNSTLVLMGFFAQPERFKMADGKTVKDYFIEEMKHGRRKPDSSE